MYSCLAPDNLSGVSNVEMNLTKLFFICTHQMGVYLSFFVFTRSPRFVSNIFDTCAVYTLDTKNL